MAVLIIGDDSLKRLLIQELEALSIRAVSAETVEEGLKCLEAGNFRLLITDLCFPDGVGFEVLEKAREGFVTVLVGKASELGAAERVLKHGVADFLPTPIDRTRLREFLGGLQASETVDRKAREWSRQIQGGKFGSMVGRSPAMQRVFQRMSRIGPSSAPVLITGESGTGKELVAKTIHDLSRRNQGPFIAVNCGAISPTLMESELFGHERGSFTGASRKHRGLFERADQGSLFLDEVTEMPLELQVKLLRALETGQITRIGAEDHRRIDVRVLAATNREPKEAIENKKLREDLYYRLKVLHVALPPLQERPGDVSLLAKHFLEEVIEREGRTRTLADATFESLEEYHWPGNARELRNAIYSAYLLSEDDVIKPEDLPSEVTGVEVQDGVEGVGLSLRIGESIENAERRLILTTLAHMDGNKTQTADILGISVKTLYNRLHAYGVMGESGKDATN